MRKTLLILFGLLVVSCVVFMILRTPDTDPAAMLIKYGDDAAKFATTDDGLEVHYRVLGDEQAPTLLLIHGSNSSLHTWGALAQRLEQDYRLVALDLPGHGLTGATPGARYDAATMVSAIEAVLAATWTDEFTVIGNSMGSWVSWRLALAMPDRVQGLILTAASGAPYDDPPEGLPIMRIAKYSWGRWVLKQITPRSVVEESVRANFSDQSVVDDAMIDRYWELLRYPGNRRAAIDRLSTDREDHYWDRIGDIKVPVLLVWGAQDRIVPMTQASKFQQALPQSQLVVYDDVGHLPMEEVPARLAQDVRAWLSAQSRAADAGLEPAPAAQP